MNRYPYLVKFYRLDRVAAGRSHTMSRVFVADAWAAVAPSSSSLTQLFAAKTSEVSYKLVTEYNPDLASEQQYEADCEVMSETFTLEIKGTLTNVTPQGQLIFDARRRTSG